MMRLSHFFGVYKWSSSENRYFKFNDKKRVIECSVDIKKPIGKPINKTFKIKYEDFIGVRLNGDIFANKSGSALRTLGLILDAFDPDINNAEYAMETYVAPSRTILYGESISLFYKKDGVTVHDELYFKEWLFNAHNYDMFKGSYVKMVNWINEYMRNVK